MSQVAAVTLEELRTIDLFDDLDDAQLGEWLPVIEPLLAEPGEILAEHGEPTPGVFLMLAGTIETFLMTGDHAEPAGRNYAPTWMGAIGVLTQGALGVRIQAETAVRAGLVSPEEFRRLAFAQPAVHRRVMEVVAPVMSRITAIEQNRERLTSLGTMAAGLAHELNNPAAAAGRAAAQMVEAVDIVSATLRRFVESGIEREQAAELVALHAEAIERAAGRTALDALDAADAEDALLERLEALGVPEPWKLAEPLAAAGCDEQWLERVAALAGPGTGAALEWVAATLTARNLAGELQEATRRMSSLVGAVKSYAYMDRGDIVEVDLHEGLETTITVLGHRLKHTSIKLVRDYDRDLPRMTVRGSDSTRSGRICSRTRSTRSARRARSRSRRVTTAIRSSSRSPTTGPASRPGSRIASSTRSSRPRTSGAAPAWDSRRLIASSSTGMTDRFASNPARPDRLHGSAPDHANLTEGTLMAATCTHLDHVLVTQLPEAVPGCVDCLATGGLWLHLRICLECGHVGCCDDSPNRHAAAHARATGHPIIRSLEPGEDWSWCFVDEIGMRIPEVRGSTRIPPSPLML